MFILYVTNLNTAVKAIEHLKWPIEIWPAAPARQNCACSRNQRFRVRHLAQFRPKIGSRAGHDSLIAPHSGCRLCLSLLYADRSLTATLMNLTFNLPGTYPHKCSNVVPSCFLSLTHKKCK